MDEKYSSTEVEVLDAQKKATKPVVGDITLFDEDGGIILIPTPTNNPNDPLNLPTWRKYLILLIVGLFAGTANLMASGAGVLMPFFMREYHGDHKTSDLATWPAFYMGVGNLLAIPVAHAVGRRPVYLIATILLAFGCLWCAKSQSLGSHIAGRNVMSIAAGQAEALCPIIVQEIFYLHQRGRIIAYFCALQTLGTASLFVASSYIGNNLGWRWWYGIFGIANGAIALLSILFVVESKFFRSITALSGQGVESDDGTLVPVTTNTKRQFDTTNFAPRSFLRDMRPWSGKAEWSEAITCWKQMFQIIWFPNILWLILTNSIGLGIYVIMTTTFAEVLVKPPFAWGFDALGYVFAGQVATAIAIPFFCGTLSDWMTKYFSKRNGGVTHPEYRLLATIIPLTAILISTFIYGQTAQHPEKWSWAGIVVTLNVEYFGFVGVIVSAFVYCMDAYPQRIDAALVLICALRGFIGFAISEGTVSFIKNNGYDGAYNICGGIVAATMVLGIPVYFFGGKIRAFTARWGQDDEERKQ